MRDDRLREGPVVTDNVLTVFTHDRVKRCAGRGHHSRASRRRTDCRKISRERQQNPAKSEKKMEVGTGIAEEDQLRRKL